MCGSLRAYVLRQYILWPKAIGGDYFEASVYTIWIHGPLRGCCRPSEILGRWVEDWHEQYGSFIGESLQH